MSRVATRQFGVIALSQLLSCGLTYAQVAAKVTAGYLHRLHRGVYAVGHTWIGDRGSLLAALLTTGQSSWLSHRTAAAVRGLRGLNLRAIELTIVAQHRSRRGGGLAIHRTASEPDPDDVGDYDGLRVSTVPRLLVELAPRESVAELERLLHASARRGALNLERIAAAIDRHGGRPGIARLRAAFSGYAPRPDRKSELERAFDAKRRTRPDIPEHLSNVWIGDWEIDCYWPKQRVALELDGRPYHVAVADTERDRVKDAKLLGMGISPMRITDRRFELDPDGAMDDLSALLALRERQSGGGR